MFDPPFETDPLSYCIDSGCTEDQGWCVAIIKERPDVLENNPIALLHVINALVYGNTNFGSIPMPDSTTLALGLMKLPRLNYSDSVKQAIRALLREDGVSSNFPPFDFLENDFPEADAETLENQGKYFRAIATRGDHLWKC